MNKRYNETLMMQFIPSNPLEWTDRDINLMAHAATVDSAEAYDPGSLAAAVEGLWGVAAKELGSDFETWKTGFFSWAWASALKTAVSNSN